MLATVYFIELSEKQRDEINVKGWNCLEGKRYLDAKDGKIDGTNFDMLVEAATGDFSNAEQAWEALQNGVTEWAVTGNSECHTSFPRSMDVGDIIVWEDGGRERVARCGFEEVV